MPRKGWSVYLAPCKYIYSSSPQPSLFCGYCLVDRLYFCQVLSLSSPRRDDWTNEWPIVSVTTRGRSASSYLKQQLVIEHRWWAGQTVITKSYFFLFQGTSHALVTVAVQEVHIPGLHTMRYLRTAWYMYLLQVKIKIIFKWNFLT